MVLRQPFAQRGRHQQQLLTITLDEVLSHAQKLLKPAGRTGIFTVYETASSASGSHRCRRARARSGRRALVRARARVAWAGAYADVDEARVAAERLAQERGG